MDVTSSTHEVYEQIIRNFSLKILREETIWKEAENSLG
jgi:hypothetical protein